MNAPPPHPVLDHSPKLRERLQEYGLKCSDNKWRGWQTKHRFVCSQGHKVSINPASLVNVRWHWRCATCRDEARLQRLCDSAALANALCLSKTWRGVQALYRFRCYNCDHPWNHRPRDIACPLCSRQRARESRRLADGLQRLQAKAAERGGQCLSDTYLGSALRHRFRCAEGHEWQTGAHEVLRGAWCLPCSHERKRTGYRLADGLERLQQAAADKGGACLSDTYEGHRHRYAFRCAEGHEWQTLGARILRGAWCPTCVVAQGPQKRRLSDGLQRLHEAAKARGGECLSDGYNGHAGQHRFRCSEGHEWEARGAVTLLQGGWCPQCARVGRRLGLEAAQVAAQARGGLCLTDTYVSNDTKMSWQCGRGHVWQTRFAVIHRGAWCPECAHMAQISSKNSKALARYEAAGYAA